MLRSTYIHKYQRLECTYLWSCLQKVYRCASKLRSYRRCVRWKQWHQGNPALPLSFRNRHVFVPIHPPRLQAGAGSQFLSLLTLFDFALVRLFFLVHPSSTPWLRKTQHAMCVCTTPRDEKPNVVGLCLAAFPTSSDSDRAPPMRGVDSRGGGFSGNSGNPPPAGGRGRGMVLPAWLVAQQNAQMAGPVSKLLPPSTSRPCGG